MCRQETECLSRVYKRLCKVALDGLYLQQLQTELFAVFGEFAVGTDKGLVGLDGARNNQTVEGVGVSPSVDDDKIHAVEEIQDVGCCFADLDIGLFEDMHHLCRSGAQFDAVDLLQLDNLDKRNGGRRIFSVATFDIITNSLRQPSVVGEIPNQSFGVEQVLHYLPVLKGSATKYSHLGRYCTFLRFCDFLFFFTIASIVTMILSLQKYNYFLNWQNFLRRVAEFKS